MKKRAVLGMLATVSVCCYSAPAAAQGTDPFLGQLMLVPYNFCPRGWANAEGQILSIAQNTALFSLLGTTYGGDGQTTFGLPDLRGRVPISQGQGTGLSNYSLGQVGGTETVTLTVNQMPTHNHAATATALIRVVGGQQANTPNPLRNSFAITGTANTFSTGTPTNNYMDSNSINATVTVGNAGGNQPFSILQPYLALQWCIALTGIYPSRN